MGLAKTICWNSRLEINLLKSQRIPRNLSGPLSGLVLRCGQAASPVSFSHFLAAIVLI